MRCLLASALLASAGLAGGALAGCSASASTSAPSLRDVTALLTRHAAAVRAHDRKAYVADLDGSGKASAFRKRQVSAYANLVRLPLTSWSYRVESRSDDRAAEKAAGKTYGAPALIVRMRLNYSLHGVDPGPTNNELWWTFVRRNGHVVVAADDGLALAGGVSWRGPWDFGPLQVVRGSASLVLGHPGDAAALRTVAATVDAAVPAVSAVWGSRWTRDVAVVVPSSAAELTAQAGASSDITVQVAAVAVSDGQDPVTGRVFGQRLIVNPAALQKLSAVGRRIVVRHEITHIAAAEATTSASPRWLVEGFADYVGNLGSGQPVRTAAAELRTEVAHGRLPSALPSEAAFDTAGQAPSAYEQAWLACRLIAQRAGPASLVRFYRLVGASSQDAGGAVASGLHAVLHESTAQFTAQWRSYLEAQLG